MRRIYMYVVSAIILIIVSYYAFQAYGPVMPFISNDKVADILQIKPEQLKEVYVVDEKYRYIPYEKDGQLHLSFWKFHERKWQVMADYRGNEILLWTLKDGEQFVVWHLEGQDMAKLNVYGIQERNYHVNINEKGERKDHYYPQIVMKETVDIEGTTSYGMLEVPADWQLTLTRTPVEDSFFAFNSYIVDMPLFYFDVVNDAGKVVETKRPDGTSGETIISDNSMIHYVSPFQVIKVEDENLEEVIE